MAHELTTTDGLVLHRTKAWHGLGTVVEDAPTSIEALRIAGLDWKVDQLTLEALFPDGRWEITTHVVNVRADTNAPLGVVGIGYRPVQNEELAGFVDALGSSGSVKIESAGSIRGGKRVWFLARGESVWPGPADEVKPYLLVANGHDGTMSVVCQPTTIRVVCKNTLHAALKAGERSSLCVRFRHEGEIADKLDDAKRALGLFTKARSVFAEQAEFLNTRSMDRDAVQRFFLEVYAAAVEPIPANAVSTAETRKVKQAQERLAQWSANFDQDRAQTGNPASAWTAVNAVTRWMEHQRLVRGVTEHGKTDQRLLNNWWGETAAAKAKVMELALGR